MSDSAGLASIIGQANTVTSFGFRSRTEASGVRVAVGVTPGHADPPMFAGEDETTAGTSTSLGRTLGQ
jgi:hypothetical protein